MIAAPPHTLFPQSTVVALWIDCVRGVYVAKLDMYLVHAVKDWQNVVTGHTLLFSDNWLIKLWFVVVLEMQLIAFVMHIIIIISHLICSQARLTDCPSLE